MATVSLKLLVDTQRNKVVFAEAKNDFVDILFSFLTLPMATIIKHLGKNSSLGCMGELYDSAVNLSDEYLETEDCKKMLLTPRSASEIPCEDLVLNVGNMDPRLLYRCPSWDCFTKHNLFYSSIAGVRCPCGKLMVEVFEIVRQQSDARDGVFLKGGRLYVVSDDLCVVPASISATNSLLQTMEIGDVQMLEEMIVEVNRSEVLRLLKASLLSKTPLSDVFLRKRKPFNGTNEEVDLLEATQVKLEHEKEATDQGKKFNLKLLQDKITKKILYAEAGNDLVDILFSFLTFPLSAIVRLLNKHASIGCADNLYRSVEVLAGDDCIKSETCKAMLLDPRLPPHFDCNNQILKIEAEKSMPCSVPGCEICWNDDMKCMHYASDVSLTAVNPKMANSSTANGGGYAKASSKFMILDEMVVRELSTISQINLIREHRVPICSLVEKEVTLGETEVLKLLKSCLVSSKALSKVFSPKQCFCNHTGPTSSNKSGGPVRINWGQGLVYKM